MENHELTCKSRLRLISRIKGRKPGIRNLSISLRSKKLLLAKMFQKRRKWRSEIKNYKKKEKKIEGQQTMYSAECSVQNWERSRLYKGGGGAPRRSCRMPISNVGMLFVGEIFGFGSRGGKWNRYGVGGWIWTWRSPLGCIGLG